MTSTLPEVALGHPGSTAESGAAALASTLEHLTARFEDCAVTTRPGHDWLTAADLFGPDMLDVLISKVLAAEAGGYRDVTGSFLASWLMSPMVQAAAEGLWRTRRVLPLEPETLWVHVHEDGWVDGVAFTAGTVVVTPADELAGTAGVEVSEDHQLVGVLADRIVALASPAFAALRERVPFGQIGMWGTLVDGLAGGALWRAQEHGEDADVTWANVTDLGDAIAERVARLRSRPRRQLIQWAGGSWNASVRGTCCLYYKTCTEPDPNGEGYCTSCPFRTDESRALRLRTYLEDKTH
jgi:hypothetical protein